MANSDSTSAVFGIHVGNTSACLAICKEEGRVDVLANDAGDRVTPAVLQWSPNGSVVGKTAKVEQFRNMTSTVVQNKQLLNENITENELKELKSQCPYKILKVNSGFRYELLYSGKQYHITPQEVTTSIFKNLYRTAETALPGNTEIKAVVSVPLYFSKQSCNIMKDAASKAGFSVLQVIDEASAAALGAGLDFGCEHPNGLYLLFRLGGVSLDTTMLEVKNGMFTVLGSVHKHNFGGKTFTEKLSEFLTEEFRRQFKNAEVTDRSRYKLFTAAENIKQILSIQSSTNCSIESLGGEYDLNCNISRARFENIISNLIQECLPPVHELFTLTNESVSNISKVILFGGSMKIPKLQETFRQMFPSAEVYISKEPDEIIAIGTAMHAGYAVKYSCLPSTLYHDTVLLNVDVRIIIKSIEEEEELETFKILRNSLLPFSKTFTHNIKNICTGLVIQTFADSDTPAQLGITTLEEEMEAVKYIIIRADIDEEMTLYLRLIIDGKSEELFYTFDLNNDIFE